MVPLLECVKAVTQALGQNGALSTLTCRAREFIKATARSPIYDDRASHRPFLSWKNITPSPSKVSLYIYIIGPAQKKMSSLLLLFLLPPPKGRLVLKSVPKLGFEKKKTQAVRRESGARIAKVSRGLDRRRLRIRSVES